MKSIVSISLGAMLIILGCDTPLDSTKSMTGLEILQHQEQVEPTDTTIHTIHVEVRNNSDAIKDFVEINATWYDANGKIVGTGMGNTTNLPSKEKRTIDVMGMNIEKASKYELSIADHP